MKVSLGGQPLLLATSLEAYVSQSRPRTVVKHPSQDLLENLAFFSLDIHFGWRGCNRGDYPYEDGLADLSKMTSGVA